MKVVVVIKDGDVKQIITDSIGLNSQIWVLNCDKKVGNKSNYLIPKIGIVPSTLREVTNLISVENQFHPLWPVTGEKS